MEKLTNSPDSRNDNIQIEESSNTDVGTQETKDKTPIGIFI